jgi:hypothetical protein
MREMLQGDLSKKLTEGVESVDLKVRECNCRGGRRAGKCQYGGFCRMPIVINRVTCKMMNKTYIGNTQQHFKRRMRGHFQDVKKLMEKGVHSRPTLCRNLTQRGSRCTIARNAAGHDQMRNPLERKPDFCGRNFWKSYLHSMQQRKIGDYQNLPINPRYTYQLLLRDTWRVPTQTKAP